ncbi:MAG: signal peptidase II [Firmicutes bacterium]|nr:signal peptidase II [Erysipelotrichaceae bacterium]MDD6525189.1 signal peptidase II [Bacillota bacterium]MDD7227911.1 signal peptidase II [Bacillota bacterium]MDY4972486.1 signal peptidase II [Erysipelotrichaceae bacterium]MDY5998586.1 signal peptidase II [Erysipelotrichaceae bacterium]
MKFKIGILGIIIIILDQFSKYFIQTNTLWQNHIEIIPNFFYITYAKNTGMGFSLLSGHTILLAIVSMIVILVIFYYYVKCDKKDVLSLVTYSLLIAGAIGNLIDRLYLGYVRDFLDFYIFGYDFPIFNIADCAVTIGAILLVLVFIKEERSNG